MTTTLNHRINNNDNRQLLDPYTTFVRRFKAINLNRLTEAQKDRLYDALRNSIKEVNTILMSEEQLP